ncbi:MAG: OmpA family protein [Epsilonproteobacteria bacterium]|nr:OmpA family protein [Campylobacterota bacterium]
MKRKLLITTLALTLLATGCAQKKVNTVDVNGNGANGVGTDTNTHTNVDPFGSPNGGGYGNYNQNTGYEGDANGGVQSIYFNVDKYVITPEMLPTVINNANLLKNNRVKIEGHCDATGTDEYNYALGLKRAKAAKDAIVSRGVSASNVTMVSMGESAPECTTGFSSDCYAKNRRVEFKVVQ